MENIKATIAFLSNYQKWRRGGKAPMPDPKEVGINIDNAIRLLREYKKQKQC